MKVRKYIRAVYLRLYTYIIRMDCARANSSTPEFRLVCVGIPKFRANSSTPEFRLVCVGIPKFRKSALRNSGASEVTSEAPELRLALWRTDLRLKITDISVFRTDVLDHFY